MIRRCAIEYETLHVTCDFDFSPQEGCKPRAGKFDAMAGKAPQRKGAQGARHQVVYAWPATADYAGVELIASDLV